MIFKGVSFINMNSSFCFLGEKPYDYHPVSRISYSLYPDLFDTKMSLKSSQQIKTTSGVVPLG